MLGVALDVYHVWWDFELMAQIERAGPRRLLAFHVCDWLVPTADTVNDRGMMGDGIIDIPRIRAASKRRASLAASRSKSSRTGGGRRRWMRSLRPPLRG